METNKTEEVVAVDVTVIETTLAKHNITETALAELQKFKDLTVEGIQDKEGYKTADEARKLCKKLRSLTKDLCGKGREHLIAQQKAWVAKEKEIVGKIQDVESYLEGQLKLVDDEKQRIKEEKEARELIQMQERSSLLISLGMKLTGENYILENFAVNVLHLKVYDDFAFYEMIAPIQARALEIEQEKQKEAEEFARLQKEQELEREKLRQEKEAFEKEQLEKKLKFEAEQKALAEQAAAIKKQQEDLAAGTLKARKSALFALGFSQQHTVLIFKELTIEESEISKQTDLQWNETLDIFTQKSEEVKKRIETERLQKIEQEKQQAIEAERARLLAIEVEKKKAEEAAKEAEILANKKAEEERLRIESLKPDAEKYEAFLEQLKAIKAPAFSTLEYLEFGRYMEDTIARMIPHFNSKKPQ